MNRKLHSTLAASKALPVALSFADLSGVQIVGLVIADNRHNFPIAVPVDLHTLKLPVR